MTMIVVLLTSEYHLSLHCAGAMSGRWAGLAETSWGSACPGPGQLLSQPGLYL